MMAKKRKRALTHSEAQAVAQLESIKEMVAALEAAEQDDGAREDAERRIHEDPLSVEVRSDWYSPGCNDASAEPAAYCILLCTGGPACRIVGELDRGQPISARIEHQDWGTPWTEWRVSSDDEAILVRYASCFYFGE